MNKLRNFCLSVFILHSVMGTAQSPSLMSYQAVIWDAAGNLVVEKEVNIRLSILQGTAMGQAVYVETHRVPTNANGLVSLFIGGGTVVSGKFTDINWGEHPFFLETETDPTGGFRFTITGTTQLVSVPYSLYAGTAGNLKTLNVGSPGQVLTIDKDGKNVWISNDAILDTSILFKNYLRIVDTAAMLSSYLHYSDTLLLNLVARFAAKLDPEDTLSLSRRIDGIVGFTKPGNKRGEILYWDGSTWITLYPGLPGQALIVSQDGIPIWSGASLPIVTTLPVQKITSNSAEVGGSVKSEGWGLINERGIVFGTSRNPTLSNTKVLVGSGLGEFITTLNGLSPGTTYYYRAFASNSAGISYGEEKSLSTFCFTNNSLANNLIAWWTLDGNSKDQSLNQNDLNNYGVTFENDPEKGQVGFFKGNSWLELSEGLFDTLTPITISFWAKTTKTYSMEIISQSCGLDCGDDIRVLLNGAYCHHEGLSFKTGAHYATAPSRTSDGNWHHYVLIMGTNYGYGYANFKFYINGELVVIGPEQCSHNWGGWNYKPNSKYPFSIGKGGPLGYFFIGNLDNIHIWNRFLSHNEVGELYRQRCN